MEGELTLLQKLARAFIPAPVTYSPRNEQEVTVSYKKDLEPVAQEVADIDLLDINEPITQEIDTTPMVQLSRLGESIQLALDKYGIVRKHNMNARVFLEDLGETSSYILGKKSTFNLFYFYYDNEIVTPSYFKKEVENSKSYMSVDVASTVRSNGLSIRYISDGIGCVLVDGGL